MSAHQHLADFEKMRQASMHSGSQRSQMEGSQKGESPFRKHQKPIDEDEFAALDAAL
jgi:hypothetical protein